MSRHFLRAIALGGVVALAACTPSTGAPATGGPPASAAATAGPPSPDVSASIQVLDFKLNPNALSVTGTTLSLSVTNAGPTVHNVTVRDAAGTVLFGTKDLREGESETVAQPIAPGTYVLFCSLPGHESLGIKGTLTVVAP